MARDGSIFQREGPDLEPLEELARLKDQFLASLNHEIRTPLSGILGITDLLFETHLNKEQHEYVSTVRFCADQLLEMLNATLEYSALSAGDGKLEEAEFHLPETLEALVGEYMPNAAAKGLKLVCHLNEDLPGYVIGDALRLRQLLAPILGNALKFTPRGEVKVTARTEEAPQGKLLLHVAIHDTGIGMAPDQANKIFESFRQLDCGLSRTYAGLGLGLAVAQKLSELLGGTIRVESRLGRGSTVHIAIPLRTPQEILPRQLTTDWEQETEAARHHNILVVEDNEVARQVVAHVLRKAKYQFHCAPGGQEGIDAAAHSQFDLILMDLQMPNVDGLQATAAIRRLPGYAEIPILALSANYAEEYRNTCHQWGLQGFLTKPIQADQLLGTLERYLTK